MNADFEEQVLVLALSINAGHFLAHAQGCRKRAVGCREGGHHHIAFAMFSMILAVHGPQEVEAC